MQTRRRQLEVSIGRGASVVVAVEILVFAFSLILGLAVRSNLAPLIGYAACILLAVSIVVMMAAVYSSAPAELHFLGLLALLAAVLYAPFCIATYYLQIAVVATNPLGHPAEVMKLIAFMPGSPLFALDMLGYGFLCMSTLCAAFILEDPRDRTLRILCIIHGALALPTVAAPIVSGIFRSSNSQANDTGSWVLLIWCALFTPIALLFSRRFRRLGEEGNPASSS
jgi:hypothetical protein